VLVVDRRCWRLRGALESLVEPVSRVWTCCVGGAGAGWGAATVGGHDEVVPGGRAWHAGAGM